jgi:hypothetical protein
MAEAVTAGAAALLPGLPDEIVVWEILVRLPPKSILRCRAVCPAWHRTTSTRAFLLAHHARQPSLPVVVLGDFVGRYHSAFAFDHRAAADARLRPIARLCVRNFYTLTASCDGLVVLGATSKTRRPCLSVCNLATRQCALLRQPRDAGLFSLLGVYLHRPSGEYRLLLYRSSRWLTNFRGDPRTIGCYVSALASDQDQPPRYIPGPEAASASALGSRTPALFRDCLHWSPVHHYRGESKLIIVFDTATESFRQMPAPAVPTRSYIFEMDGKLGIYSYNAAMKVVHIWVYEGEGWEYKHRVELPTAEIMGQCGGRQGLLVVNVVSGDGVVLLLLSHGEWLFYVDVDGKLVHSFHLDGKTLLHICGLRLKQTLVPHTFFTALEDYAVNASPFI